MSVTERSQRPGESDAVFARRLARYDDEGAAYRAMLALDAGGMASWLWDIPGGTVQGDACWAEFFAADADTHTASFEHFRDRVHPDDREDVAAALDVALKEDEEYEVEFRIRNDGIDPEACTGNETEAEGAWRWIGGRGRVTQRGEDGAPLAMLGVNWDLTDQKEHEKKLELLAGEMDHRVKNSFAVMRALITIGQRQATDVDQLCEDLRAQVQAMADAHSMSAGLARRKLEPRPHVPVEEVLRSALAPWTEGFADRVSIEVAPGSVLGLRAQGTSSLAMLAYELATNAAKYGPLGERDGTLTIQISPDPDEADLCHLQWTERCEGEPFAEEVADRQAKGSTSGFGSVLLQHCASALKARMHQTLRPEGMAYEFRFPATSINGS